MIHYDVSRITYFENYCTQVKNFDYKVLRFFGETFDWDIMAFMSLHIIICFTRLLAGRGA